MKPPGWLVMAPKSEWTRSPDGKHVNVGIRVRRWHPGFWVALLRYWWTGRA